MPNKAFIINGKKLKSINQYYNKKKAYIQQELEKRNGKKKSKRLSRLNLKRNNKVKDYMHKASKRIVEECISQNITTVVVGHNDGWKQEVDLGKKNNQNFVNIPFDTFISMLKYKSERQGLRFIVVNESHTSKCSSLDLETVEHHEMYTGKRVKRGLFRTHSGILLNADINGAYNIMRKAKGDAFMPPRYRVGYNPVKINI